MCAKFTQVVSRMIPPGPLKDSLKSSYYSFYYNAKHFRENGFRVYYRNGHFEYRFDPRGGVIPQPEGHTREGVDEWPSGGIPLHGRDRDPALKGAMAVRPWSVTFASYENFADELKRSLAGYLARRPLRPGDTVVDCGAYIGEFTLYAAAAVGRRGTVVAFEPDPAIFKSLEANIALNGFGNIKAVNKGVWRESGELKFVGDNIKGYSFMAAEADENAIKVPVVSLDAELPRLGLGKVDFIKMDVEGAEIEAVKGAEKTLRAGAPSLAIASYHLVDGRKSYAALENILASFGYAAETGHPQHLTTYAVKKDGPDSGRGGER